ncbi:MAG: hypothetical protein KDC43_10235 [Saprospiraceae bacterium]|nr:hypothetical protein [Saprospiraceae bacterium]MCB0624267.1 hypothetical protein [Saprospiraceae bacterium]MCB0684642.1 hypothetical protein [Saprospiraceae bacterium]
MEPIVYTTPAILWDGAKQLPGQLVLRETELHFHPDTFQKSHLSLIIRLREIDLLEEYLVFDLARNGLRIGSRGQKADLFVMEEVTAFRRALQEQLSRLI